MLVAKGGHDPNKGLRIDLAEELMVNAAMNTTIAIFYRGSGTTVFKSGILNHVSGPSGCLVIPSRIIVDFLLLV